LLRETRPDEFSPREALELLSRLKGLVVSRPGSGSLVDRKYCEQPDSRWSGDPTCVGKLLILQNTRVQIPYAAEQGNKSDEQGDKIDD